MACSPAVDEDPELDRLWNVDDPAIDEVVAWVAASEGRARIAGPAARGVETLRALGVSRRSVLGALAAETGGLMVDHGWLRHLGGGGGIGRDLATWNRRGAAPRMPGALLVADDVLGGFFAIDGGGCVGEVGHVCYRDPRTMTWQSLGLRHSEFVRWSVEGGGERFYDGVRWDGWRADVAAVGADQVLSFYPPLWAVGPSLLERSRRPVPAHEAWDLWTDLIGTPPSE